MTEKDMYFNLVPEDLIGKGTIIVFILAIPFPIRYPLGERKFLPSDVDAPWIKFTNGKSFVGINMLSAPDAIDREMRDDINAGIWADALVNKQTLLEFPRMGSELEGQPLVDKTIAELVTPIKVSNSENAQLEISDAFDRCLAGLNAFLLAYMQVDTNPKIRLLSRQNCRSLIPMLFQDDAGTYHSFSLFGPKHPVPPISSNMTLSEDELWQLAVAEARNAKSDPFTLFIERSRAARRFLEVEGDYSSSIIAVQTSVEILANSLILFLAWERGVSRKETLKWFAAPFSMNRRISTHLQPILGGNWTNPADNNVLDKIKYVSDLRNRIVHAGIPPSESEAKKASEFGGDFEHFVKSRLAAKMKSFPRTTLLLLGEPGLKKRGYWTRWIQTWIKNNASLEDDWLETFNAWRDGESVN